MKLWTLDFGLWTQPTFAAGFEQIKSAEDIRRDEIARPGDGTVHMGFRREVHDVRDAVLFDNPQRGRLVTQINLLKNIFRMLGDRLQIFQSSRVSQAVEVDELGDFRIVNDVLDEIRADEARAAGNE